jgi:hypothetical protein
MTRNQRIHKLANAIRAYKGKKQDIKDEHYLVRPQPARINDIKRHLTALGLNVKTSVTKINKFLVFDDLHQFILKLDNHD